MIAPSRTWALVSAFHLSRSFPFAPFARPHCCGDAGRLGFHVFAPEAHSTFDRDKLCLSERAKGNLIIAHPSSQLRLSFGRFVRKGGLVPERLFGQVRAMAAAVDAPPQGYRANVGICMVNNNNEVFVASRLDVPGAWQMPQGGVNDNEDPWEAASRELKEETGVTSSEIIAEVPGWLTYDFPPDVKTKLTRLWGKEWDGQAQKWFLFRFHGNEDEINLDGDGEEPAEFSEYKWLPIEEVISRAVDFKRPVYERVFETFSPILKSQHKPF